MSLPLNEAIGNGITLSSSMGHTYSASLTLFAVKMGSNINVDTMKYRESLLRFWAKKFIFFDLVRNRVCAKSY
jgi:hypothetical protein